MPSYIYLFVGPSGVGKDTFADIVKQAYNIPFLVGYTSRPPRKDEDASRMIFETRERMRELKDEFFVATEYCGNYYGTKTSDIEAVVQSGTSCLMIVDGNTAQLLHQDDRWKGRVQIFYIIPKTHESLTERLEKRGWSDELIQHRLEKNKAETDMMDVYIQKHAKDGEDGCHIIVNDSTLESAYNQIACIIDRLECMNERVCE